MSLRQHLRDKNYSQFNEIERERENVIKSSQGKGECNSSVLVNISKCTTFEYVFLFSPLRVARLSITNNEIERRKCRREDTVKQIQELRGTRHLQIGRLKREKK